MIPKAARRGFDEALRAQPDPRSASCPCAAIEFIGKPYVIERYIKEAPSEVRRAVRQAQSKPIANGFRTLLEMIVSGTAEEPDREGSPLHPVEQTDRLPGASRSPARQQQS